MNPTGADDLGTAQLAVLEQLVRDIGLPSPQLPGWESFTADEYARAVRSLAGLLDSIAAALGAARSAG